MNNQDYLVFQVDSDPLIDEHNRLATKLNRLEKQGKENRMTTPQLQIWRKLREHRQSFA